MFRGRAVALLLTIVVHVLILAPAFSRSVRHASASSDALEFTWIEPSGNAIAAPLPEAHLQAVKLEEVEAAATIPDDSASEYVRRMAALTARIQGAWKLPHARLAADFHCRARLRTGESGAVEEVELENCDTSGPVRASIALAIEHAKPLPLPQEHAIVLQFIAYARPDGASVTSIEPAAN